MTYSLKLDPITERDASPAVRRSLHEMARTVRDLIPFDAYDFGAEYLVDRDAFRISLRDAYAGTRVDVHRSHLPGPTAGAFGLSNSQRIALDLFRGFERARARFRYRALADFLQWCVRAGASDAVRSCELAARTPDRKFTRSESAQWSAAVRAGVAAIDERERTRIGVDHGGFYD